MKTKIYLLLASLAALNPARAEDPLPKRPDFTLYAAMLARSPFAVATAPAAPAATPDFAKDLYVANIGKLANDYYVSIASTTEKNFKEYLSSKEANEHGWSIDRIDWSDQPGASKVTITKDGKNATLSFNQAIMAQPMASQLPLPNQPPAVPNLPQAFIKPAPIPVLSSPNANNTPINSNRTHIRGMIPRNPGSATPPPDN